jgi:hypothetical protein
MQQEKMAVNSQHSELLMCELLKFLRLVLMEQLVFLHASWLRVRAIKGKRRLQTGFVKNSTGTCFCPGRQQQRAFARESSRRRQHPASDFAESNPEFLVRRLWQK